MGANSKISWLGKGGATWNPFVGCGGCGVNCYAARMTHRFHKNWKITKTIDGRACYNGKLHFNESAIGQLVKWKRPRSVFVESMGDLFFLCDIIKMAEIWKQMLDAPQHTYLLLTKIPRKMFRFLETVIKFPPHLWLGVTAENQYTWNERVSVLLDRESKPKFVSVEPMLGKIDISKIFITTGKKPAWIICGPETGPGARPFEQKWADDLWRQCTYLDIPFFWKGEKGEMPREFPKTLKI